MSGGSAIQSGAPVSGHPLFFVGSGHGGLAAFRSLRAQFSSLEIVSVDRDVLALARPQDAICEGLGQTTASVGVMAGYLDLIPSTFLADRTILNVHYSLLPKYRGLHALAWAMLNCENELGWSVHIVNEFVDDGPIVHQQSRPYNGETSAQLMDIFDADVEERLGRVVSDYIAGKIKPVAQDKSLATWVPRRNRESCVIDFSWPADRLSALFKALVPPYPVPILRTPRGDYDVIEADVVRRDYFCDIGRVVNIDGDGVWIKCADCLLVIRTLASPGGRMEARREFRLGSRISQ